MLDQESDSVEATGIKAAGRYKDFIVDPHDDRGENHAQKSKSIIRLLFSGALDVVQNVHMQSPFLW